MECNSIRPGGHAQGIVTKTVHKTLPGSVFLWLFRECWDVRGLTASLRGIQMYGYLGYGVFGV